MGQIVLVMGMSRDWERYMPGLIQYAKSTHCAVRILEFAAPMGLGMFTSNSYPGDDAYPKPANPVWTVTGPHFDPVLIPADTAEAALEIEAFLETVVNHLRTNGLQVTAEWLPAFDQSQIGEYARAHDATTVALLRRGWWARLIEGNARPMLKSQGFSVLDLEPWDAGRLQSPTDSHPNVMRP